MKRVVMLCSFALLSSSVYAGGVWSEQYCNMQTETRIFKDENGKITDTQVVEVMRCDDGAKDFLAYSGIAKECQEYFYTLRLGSKLVQRKGYACEKFDGTWEVVNPRGR